MNRHSPIVLYGFLLVAVSALAGCDSDPSSPTKPSPPLTVMSSSTATQGDLIAWRVQLRLRVTEGLADLAEAVQTGAAGAEVCVQGTCVDESLTSTPTEGLCLTAVGVGTVEIEAAWLDGDQAGIDFCVSSLTTAATYETTLGNGVQQSNTIDTECSLSGGFLACVSS